MSSVPGASGARRTMRRFRVLRGAHNHTTGELDLRTSYPARPSHLVSVRPARPSTSHFQQARGWRRPPGAGCRSQGTSRADAARTTTPSIPGAQFAFGRHPRWERTTRTGCRLHQTGSQLDEGHRQPRVTPQPTSSMCSPGRGSTRWTSGAADASKVACSRYYSARSRSRSRPASSKRCLRAHRSADSLGSGLQRPARHNCADSNTWNMNLRHRRVRRVLKLELEDWRAGERPEPPVPCSRAGWSRSLADRRAPYWVWDSVRIHHRSVGRAGGTRVTENNGGSD